MSMAASATGLREGDSPAVLPRAGRWVPFCLALLILLSASWALADAAPSPRTVRVGSFPTLPLSSTRSDSISRGLFADILNEVAAREDWRIEWVPGSFTEGMDRLRAGEIDLMPGASATAGRAAHLDFCEENVVMVWGQVYAAADASIQRVLDLDGRRVALVRDDLSGEQFIETARAFGVAFVAIQVDTHAEAFRLIEENEVAAGVAPNLFGFGFVQQRGIVPTPIIFAPLSSTFAAAKGRNTGLLRTIDRYLKRWKADPGSVYAQSLQTYTGLPAPGSGLLPKWLVWVVAGFVLAALTLLLWVRILDARVRARTRELSASQAKMRIIFDQTFQFLGLIDVEGRLQEVNQTASAFVNASTTEFIGWYFWDCPWWSHDPALQQQVREGIAKARQGEVHFGEARHIDAAGKPHAIRYTIKPAVSPEGRVESLIAEGHDITAMYELEEELRRSQRMEAMGTLAGGIAHDFNNILTAVIGFNEIAQEEAREHPRILDNLKQIETASNRARELVEQILAFGRRREDGTQVYTPRQIVHEVSRLLQSSLPSTIRIRTSLETESSLMGNPTHFHQIAMNLATNAYHAMEEGGGLMSLAVREVTFEESEPIAGPTIPAGTYVLLEVGDTGAGMDDETLERVFEPYFTTKAPGKGTGLGLAVVRGLVESADGHLRVRSEPGVGTTFQVYFPALVQAAPVENDLQPEFAPLRGTERILCVDDESTLTHLVSCYLNSLGYRVTTAADGYQAWELFRDDPGAFDLVITDQTMPGLTGRQLIERIRNVAPRLPVILSTGHATEDVESLRRELGIHCVMHKPMMLKDLAAEVRAALAAGRPLDS